MLAEQTMGGHACGQEWGHPPAKSELGALLHLRHLDLAQQLQDLCIRISKSVNTLESPAQPAEPYL